MKRRIEKRISPERIAWIAWSEDGRLAVEFWCSTWTAETAKTVAGFGRVRDFLGHGLLSSGGIEKHRTPADGEKVSQLCCTMIGGPCCHDGTSTGAADFFEYWGGSDEEAYRLVEDWVQRNTRTTMEAVREEMQAKP